MAELEDKGYTDKKQFICTGCGKEIMLTKFASQKTCKCDDCKEKNIPTNPDIVAKAMDKNPPKKMRPKEESTDGGSTKDRPCIQCGKMVTVSKFMSDQKVLCDDCKGTSSGHSTKTIGLTQRLSVDLNKLDRSKLLPIQEYEVNEVVIANKKLRKVTCPACGHEHMKPLMILDWSQFGLVIEYQCPSCLLTMLISEQQRRMLSRHSPGKRFDYTGAEIKELSLSNIESTRMSNAIGILTKKLEENNIKIDDEQVPPYKWKCEKPVPVGYIIPDTDEIIDIVSKVRDALKNADRQGESVDMPEGSRYIQISDTLAKGLADKLDKILKGDTNELNTTNESNTTTGGRTTT